MVNTDKIKGRMRELRITQADIANELGIRQPTVNQKINNIRCFTLDEADKLQSVLKIEPSEFASYFFA